MKISRVSISDVGLAVLALDQEYERIVTEKAALARQRNGIDRTIAAMEERLLVVEDSIRTLMESGAKFYELRRLYPGFRDEPA